MDKETEGKIEKPENKTIEHKKTDKLGSIIGIIFLILIAIFVFKLINWEFLGDKITAYPALCKYKTNFGNCKNPDFTLNKTTYIVNASKQEVLNTTGIVEKYKDCAVGSRTNWSCKYDDKSAEFGFNNGSYFEIPNYDLISQGASNPNDYKNFVKDQADKTYYVGRLSWIMIQCKDQTGLMKYICFPLLVILD